MSPRNPSSKASPLWSPGRIALLTWLLLVAIAPVLLAQSTAETAPPAEAQAAQEGTAVPADRRTPRAAIRTFLVSMVEADQARSEAMRQRLLRDAIATLDLSDLPPSIRDEEGFRLAFELKDEVLDRFPPIEYDDIPDYEQGEPVVLVASEEDPDRTVALTRTAQGWQFSRETIAAIPALAQEFSGRSYGVGVVVLETLKPPSDVLRDSLPYWLKEQFVTLYLYQWIGIAVLAVLALAVGRTLIFILLLIFGKRLKHWGVANEEESQYVFNWPMGLAFAVMVWWGFDGWLGLPPAVSSLLARVMIVLMGVGIITSLYRLINVISDRLTEFAARTPTKYDDLLVPFVRKTSKAVILIVGPMAILDNLGMDLTTMLGTLAIGGLAVSLAAKDTISNVFGTITIIADRPFQIGDWVVVEGAEGTVEELGFRSTRIRTFYNSLISVPNSNMTNAVVDNYGRRIFRRYVTEIAVTYDTSPDKVEAFCEGIREIVRIHPYTRKDYFHVYFQNYGASSLNIMVYMFFKVPDWATELRERHRLNLDIYRLAKRLGIDFAFPTQTLYLERGPGPGQPDLEPPLGINEIDSRQIEAKAFVHEMVEQTLGPPGTMPPPVSFKAPPAAGTGLREGPAEG